jgi:hypothetical protein
MAKYLDQAGLQLVLSKITNKYDGRYLGLHATADAAQKVVHSLSIQVGDEELRVFDGQADHSIEVAAKVHGHQAGEVAYSNGSVTGAANVKDALDIIVKNIQLTGQAISATTQVAQDLRDALDQEIEDRAAADENLQEQVTALKDIVDEKLDGDGNIFDILDDAKEELQGMIDTEKLRAEAAEKALADRATAVEGRLDVIEGDEATEGSIKKAVNDEKVRAEGAEQVLRDNLAAEVSRADTEEKRIDKKLDDEITNRGLAEEALSQRIEANKGRLDVLEADENTEGSIAKDIKDAEGRVKVVTDALDGRLTGAEGRLDVIQGTGEGSIKKAIADLVGGAPELLDTLDELAAALKDNPDIITVLENEYKAAVQAEKEAREAKDLLQDQALAKEVEDREAAVAGEKAAREAADNGLSARLDVIETKVKAEDMSLAEVKEALNNNDQAIKQEVQDRKDAVKGVQDQIDIIDGAVDVEGSFRKAIADQAATQLAKDQAQDGRMDAIELEIGEKKTDSADSTGMYQFIFQQVEAEATARANADTLHDSRLAAIEELIGDGEGSTTLKDLNQRLTQAEADIDQCQKDIVQNAKDIAAIVALEEADIDAAFNAIFQ